jgi:nucleoside-diphosphate-sugar epimerase
VTGVVIVGGAGFIGRKLASALGAQGRTVRGLSRAECDLTRLDAEEPPRKSERRLLARIAWSIARARSAEGGDTISTRSMRAAWRC